jgi:alpha-mannosidase
MVNIPTWKSELYFEYHRGVMTTQANHKKNMREAEEQMLDAEKWASLAWVLAGRAYPSSDFTEDWKKVLFNQFHDTAAGSGIGVIYKDAQKDYDVVRWSTNEIDAKALNAVAERIDTHGDGIQVLVYNPLGWTRSGDVSITVQIPNLVADGLFLFDPDEPSRQIVPISSRFDDTTKVTELTFHATGVPPLGYKVFRITPGIPKKALAKNEGDDSADFVSLRQDGVHVVVEKKSGCITKIWRDDYQYLPSGACANQLQFFGDTPKDYDAWNIDPGTLDVLPKAIEKPDSVELIPGDPVRPAIRVSYHWQNSKFVQTISLDGDQIDIDNEIDWHENHVLLKTAFPLAASGPFATYEIPYGTIDRPTTRNNSWEKAQFEVTALRWADLSGPGPDGKVHGLSVLNQNKYGYDAVGNVLRLTLLRSPKWPDAEADMGHHHFHYALYPHAGTWKDALTVRHGYEYNYPLTAVVTTAHPGALPPSHSFASVSPENVVLTAVKKAEDANGLIFRVYEWAGKETTAEFHVPPGATSATVTNLMETPEGAPLTVTGDVVKAPIHPYEILTIRVDYPNAGPKP